MMWLARLVVMAVVKNYVDDDDDDDGGGGCEDVVIVVYSVDVKKPDSCTHSRTWIFR